MATLPSCTAACSSPSGSPESDAENSDSDPESPNSDPESVVTESEAGSYSTSRSSSEGEDSPRSKKCRKRRRRVDKWKATQRKKRRNSGQPYTSKTGKQVRYTIALA